MAGNGDGLRDDLENPFFLSPLKSYYNRIARYKFRVDDLRKKKKFPSNRNFFLQPFKRRRGASQGPEEYRVQKYLPRDMKVLEGELSRQEKSFYEAARPRKNKGPLAKMLSSLCRNKSSTNVVESTSTFDFSTSKLSKSSSRELTSTSSPVEQPLRKKRADCSSPPRCRRKELSDKSTQTSYFEIGPAGPGSRSPSPIADFGARGYQEQPSTSRYEVRATMTEPPNGKAAPRDRRPSAATERELLSIYDPRSSEPRYYVRCSSEAPGSRVQKVAGVDGAGNAETGPEEEPTEDESAPRPGTSDQPSIWYCEKFDRNRRRPKEGPGECQRVYESVIEPLVRQAAHRTPQPSRLFVTQLSPEEKRKLAKIVAVILATAGFAALIMLLLRFRRPTSRAMPFDEERISSSSDDRSDSGWVCDDEDEDEDATCIFEKFDRVKCKNDNFKAILQRSEKLRENENKVCASEKVCKITKRIKEPRHWEDPCSGRGRDRRAKPEKCFGNF